MSDSAARGPTYISGMRSRLRLEMELTEAGKQLLTTENTDQHGKSKLMLIVNFEHRPMVRIEPMAVQHFRVFRG
jgi:hypothetical protein